MEPVCQHLGGTCRPSKDTVGAGEVYDRRATTGCSVVEGNHRNANDSLVRLIVLKKFLKF